MQRNIHIKLILLGQAGIGKTHLACRFKEQEQPLGVLQTIGVDCYSKLIKIDGKVVSLNIWDTAGQERFRSLTRQFYTNADCAFICFSVCDISSLRKISDIKRELEEKGITDIYLVGTQTDSLQRLPQSIIESIIKTYNIPTFYTSSYTGENVNEVFETMIKQCLEKVEKNIKNESILLKSPPKEDSTTSLCQCILQ